MACWYVEFSKALPPEVHMRPQDFCEGRMMPQDWCQASNQHCHVKTLSSVAAVVQITETIRERGEQTAGFEALVLVPAKRQNEAAWTSVLVAGEIASALAAPMVQRALHH